MSSAVAQIEQVTKTYHRDKVSPPVHALRDINLSIQRGQYLAIMGPSGSGKSTLMNIIGCLDRPSSGRYLLDGENVADMADEALSKVRGKRLGFVFQAFNLIPQLTVLENVAVPLFYQAVPSRTRTRMARKALERVGLGDRLDHRPSQLSGGQQQRAAIARALVNKPSVLLADEPTGNLDSTTGQVILDLFDQLHSEGLTVIIVTHEDSVAERCQRIINLKDGHIDKDNLTHRASR